MNDTTKLHWKNVARGIVACVTAVTMLAATSFASDVVSVEEHWELQLGNPDPNSSAPQVSLTMSPNGSLDGKYFVFTLNHQTLPQYEPGGLQVQLWDGDEVLEDHLGPYDETLSYDNETISWVQRLTFANGVVTFEIVDGQSQTWGQFGGEGHLTASTETSLTNLNSYVPAISLSESHVAYGGNRVQSLVLKELSWTTADGETHELFAPIDIDTDLDP